MKSQPGGLPTVNPLGDFVRIFSLAPRQNVKLTLLPAASTPKHDTQVDCSFVSLSVKLLSGI